MVEEVHLDAVAARVHGRHLSAVECGLDVTVAQTANKHEVAHSTHARNTLDGACNVAVARLLDLLAGNEDHAGSALLFDVLHVDVTRAVHFGHNFCGLVDDVRLDVQIEIDHDDVVGDGDFFRDGSVANETSDQLVGAWCKAFEAEVAIQIGHGPHVGIFDHHVGANQGFPGLGVRHFATNGTLSPCE